MTLPVYDMRRLLDAGVHFGHRTRRWNPKMAPYIFGSRHGIHVMDLSRTVPLIHRAMLAVRNVVSDGGRILFVGTGRQAAEPVARHAVRCAQYYVNSRWLGGTLTNWKTISSSIARLRELDSVLGEDDASVGRTKKEILKLTRERDRLERTLGGIRDMSRTPQMLFVIDTNRESIAVSEARRLHIPIVAVLDSDCNPDGIDHPIPGNDDAARAVETYCELVADAAIEGLRAGGARDGDDPGADDDLLYPPFDPDGAQSPSADGASEGTDLEGRASDSTEDSTDSSEMTTNVDLPMNPSPSDA